VKVALVLAGLLLGGVAHADDVDVEADDVGVEEHDIVEVKPGKKPIEALAVDNQLGDVTIIGHDGKGLIIYAYKHGPDDAALDQLRVSLIPDPDGPVKITTSLDRAAEKTTLPAGEVRIDLVIRAPRDARIDARVGRGKLSVRDMDAGGELDTGAGTISVENVSGSVYARSVDGNQRFEDMFGDLDVGTLTADLAFDTVRGDELIASVHDGEIDARRVKSKRIELRATKGKIHLESELVLNGSLVIESRHGDVDVSVKSPGGIKLKARAGATLNLMGAETTSNADAEWVKARYGKAKRAAAVELRSRYGDVRFAIIE